MRIGLYSITYRGVWYRGDAVDVFNLVRLAKEHGFEGLARLDSSHRTGACPTLREWGCSHDRRQQPPTAPLRHGATPEAGRHPPRAASASASTLPKEFQRLGRTLPAAQFLESEWSPEPKKGRVASSGVQTAFR